MKKLKVHPKLGKVSSREGLVELVGYVAESDPKGITELWITLSGEDRLLVPTDAIIEAAQDEEGPTRIWLKGSSTIEVVRYSRQTMFASGFYLDRNLGPTTSIKIGTTKDGKDIWIHFDSFGNPWEPPLPSLSPSRPIPPPPPKPGPKL